MTEQLYVGGRIVTMAEDGAEATAMLVRDGEIVAIGAESPVRAAAAAGATVIDLGGRMVMPGLHDAHTHLLLVGLKLQTECRLRVDASADEIVEDLCTCERCEAGKLSNWVIGGEYNPLVFPPGTLDRAFLDEKFPDTPVYLYDFTIHNALANSAALALAGIDADTEDPFGGRYVRRAGSREPTGELVERATWAVRRVMPPYPDHLYRNAVTWAVGMANSFGITSAQEASASPAELRVLNALDGDGELPIHLAAHIVWREEDWGDATGDELDRLIADRGNYASHHVRTDFVKCWMDGAPIPPHFTGAGIDPETNEIDTSNLLISQEDLTEQLAKLDREGVTMKIHCGGMGSVRVALNAVEEVRRRNGPDGPRHEVAHAGFVHPDDQPRFGPARMTAEMSPAVWHLPMPPEAKQDAAFQFRTMTDLGAHMTIGTDWIFTPEPNLFPPLQGMLQRGAESVDLDVALRALTIDGAKAVGLESRIGSLEVGKSADFIVLDRDLYAIPVDEVGNTVVLNTVFEGRVVHAAPGAPIGAAS
ncbi:MAG TPA: amidohydrolase [Pseudolysinimonas sp.]|nr:amidohydrolase [Pseudolysinimonas sp.]